MIWKVRRSCGACGVPTDRSHPPHLEKGVSMNFLRNVSGVVSAAIAFAAFAPSAVADKIIVKYACQNVGAFASEPLGDREGHSISVGQFSCRVDAGPMSGGVMSGTAIWEWDKTNAVLVVGQRRRLHKPGATVVYQDMDGGKLALTLADGKVTGYTASGRRPVSRLRPAVAASLAGKSATWTSMPAGRTNS